MYLNNDINIIVLCNNEIVIPALQQLFISGALKAVVIPEKNIGLISILKPLLAGSPVSLVTVNKKNLEAVIKNLAIEKKITAAWLMTFAYIIPPSLLKIIPGGFINFHYGLLPKYRGPNPILAQMLQYETQGGITIHTVDEGIDTGPIIMQQKIAISDKDTFGMQLQKLSLLAASMATNLLKLYQLSPVLPSVMQDKTQAAYFKKPVAADLMINWQTMSSTQIVRLINACNPWNKGAGSVINNMVVCFTEAELINDVLPDNIAPGTIAALNDKEGLKIYCVDKKLLKVNIIYTPEGFFTGRKLLEYGIKLNNRFS